MKLYTDTELDNDIKYVKDMIYRYGEAYKKIGKKFSCLNKTCKDRICFILSLFKNIFLTNKMWI